MLDPNNMANKDFTKGFYQKRDGIGLGMNSGLLQYFEMAKKDIKGIVCSTNDDGVSD
jgi:hypothetical protein